MITARRDQEDFLKRFLSALALLGLLASCGGGSSSPSTPTVVATPRPAPTPTPSPSARDGLTEQAVAAEVTPPAPAVGAPLQARASGYLVREQPWDGSPILLWPGEDAYVRELVYDWDFQDGSHRIVRWDHAFKITLDGDLADDPAVLAKTREVIGEVARTTGLTPTIGPGGEVLVKVDPSILEGEDAVAYTDYKTYRGPTITGVEVVFFSRQEISGGTGSQYRNTLLHEMGHVLGLGHSPSDHDVMTPGVGYGTRVSDYQDGESGCLRMMYQRRKPGNIFPDRESSLGLASNLTPGPRRIVDRFPGR